MTEIETPLTRDAAQFVRHCRLDAGARALLKGKMTTRSFIDELVANERIYDAIRFLACVLPPRHSVWWGCLCAWCAYRDVEIGDQESDALEAAAHWVLDPTEVNREKAEAAGTAADMDNPGGALASAAGWSSTLESGGEPPPASADPDFAARAVAGSLFLSAASIPADDSERYPRLFLDWGLEVAELSHPWNADEDNSGEGTGDRSPVSDSAERDHGPESHQDKS